MKNWLPVTRKQMKKQGWQQADIILFTGDAYVDHPSFGAALIGRVLEARGYKVAIVPQPNWQDDLRDFKKMGPPGMFFLVTAGNLDSMVNHYTANRRKRSNDAYTPGGKAGFRPDYATIVYTTILKKIFPGIPVILGGIEASLRRFTHYDYWSDKLKKSILADSNADLIVYGMGEKAIVEIADLYQKGVPLENLKSLPQIAAMADNEESIPQNKNWAQIHLASHSKCLNDKKIFAKNFSFIEHESNKLYPKQIIQRVDDKFVVVNPPYPAPETNELDAIYELPFTRLPHPKYQGKGNIPAFEMIKFSVNSHRGCFGGCSFCTISAHQGKFIASRSHKSILSEIDTITTQPGFKGYISDIGGPSANMYQMKGSNPEICAKCSKSSCIFPVICPNLDTNHSQINKLYGAVRKHEKIKKVTIGSGIRYDLFFDKKRKIPEDRMNYIRNLLKYHVSGRLKVAPEHTSPPVLQQMRKPDFNLFERFNNIFNSINTKNKLRLQLIPYFISSHPACTNVDMANLAITAKKQRLILEQVQDFTPTPMTLSTVIYYSGYDPYTLKKVYTAKDKSEKLAQQKYFFWYKPQYRKKIISELKSMHRQDLINSLFGKK